MKRYIAPVLFAALLLGAVGCEDLPINPLTDSMSATVNGSAWSTPAATAITTNGVTAVSGSASLVSTTDIMALTLAGVSAPGTYSIGGLNTTNASYRRDTINYTTAVSVTNLTPPGTLQITQYGNGRVAGTFSFIAFRDGDPATKDSVIVTGGSFNVKLN